jgi:Nuclease-related domain
MKVFINRQKVNTRARLSNLASIGGLVLLLASVVVPLVLPSWSEVAYILLVVGLGVAMVGIYFANRWVRKPRPEDSLSKALKSFDDHYHIYHYAQLPCDHVVLTPTGIVLLEVYNITGSFSYQQGHWKEAMTVGRALRYIVEERVSNPIALMQHLEIKLKERLEKELEPGLSIQLLCLHTP